MDDTDEMLKKYPILKFFAYQHLPPSLQQRSKPYCELAWNEARSLPQNAETATALRKLLEAKDAGVRASIP